MASSRIMQVNHAGVVSFSSGPTLPEKRSLQARVSEFRQAACKKRLLMGNVLAVANDIEVPVVGALVELHAVSPLHAIASQLSAPVLAHLRALLLEGVAAVDLYQGAEHVVDAPSISIADIDLLKRIAGYELLVSAARLQPDVAFRQMLCNCPAILRPLLCYYHPCSFSSQRIAVVASDQRGAFQFSVQQSEDIGAQSGYYFIVRRQFSGNLFVTLYEPSPITWHARWENLDQELIKLSTRHPQALR